MANPDEPDKVDKHNDKVDKHNLEKTITNGNFDDSPPPTPDMEILPLTLNEVDKCITDIQEQILNITTNYNSTIKEYENNEFNNTPINGDSTLPQIYKYIDTLKEVFELTDDPKLSYEINLLKEIHDLKKRKNLLDKQIDHFNQKRQPLLEQERSSPPVESRWYNSHRYAKKYELFNPPPKWNSSTKVTKKTEETYNSNRPNRPK